MKKIILYVDDEVVDVYRNIFSKKCFNEFKKIPEETKIELGLEGMKIAKKLDEEYNEKEYCLYNAYVNMAVISEHLIDVKVEL